MARLQGGRRTRRDVVLLLRRVAVALGRGAIDALRLGPLRRALRSESARKRIVAAQGARRAWCGDPEPARDPLLQRAVARAGGAIQFVLAPGRRALTVVHNLLQRVLGVRRYFRQHGLFLGFRLLLLRLRPRPRQGQPHGQPQLQPPPPPPQPLALALLYAGNPLRRRAPAPASPAPTPPSSPPPTTVDGVIVPQEVIDQYSFFCSLASTCPAKWTICHFCVFYIQKSPNFRVPSYKMIGHCEELHRSEGPSVRCNETGCSVRVPPGRELALHEHFCHS